MNSRTNQTTSILTTSPRSYSYTEIHTVRERNSVFAIYMARFGSVLILSTGAKVVLSARHVRTCTRVPCRARGKFADATRSHVSGRARGAVGTAGIH